MPIRRVSSKSGTQIQTTIYPELSLLRRINTLEQRGGIMGAFKSNKNRQILYLLEIGIKTLEVSYGKE